MESQSVGQIIKKLRNKFGNPEILKTTLARKIQQPEGSSSESLEFVNELGSVVEDFTQRRWASGELKGAGLITRLKNLNSNAEPGPKAAVWCNGVDHKRRARVVGLETFGSFMENLVEKTLEATFKKAEVETSNGGGSRRTMRKWAYTSH